MKIGFRCEYKTLYDRLEDMSAPVRRSPVAWPNGYIAILFATDCISRMMEESRMRA